MGLITLLTDYKYKDFYLAKVESRIKRLYVGDDLLHLSHGVCNFELTQAAYNFNAIKEDFSSDSWHFIFVNIHYSHNYKIIVAKSKEHGTIVTPDNGLLGLIDCEFEAFYKLPIKENSFPELNILEACQKKDQIIEQLKPIDSPNLFRPITPIVSEREVKGEVIYIDGYGNCITNIDQETFENFTTGQPYFIKVRLERIERISVDYSENRQAGITAFFNHQGHLEIATTHGNASKLLGLQTGSRISVKKN